MRFCRGGAAGLVFILVSLWVAVFFPGKHAMGAEPPQVLGLMPGENEAVQGTVVLTVYARCQEGAVFSLDYRSEMTGWEWLPLGNAVETARAEGVASAVYEWDTGSFPAGYYGVRAVVTDAGGTAVGPVQGEGQDWRLLFVQGAPPEQPSEQETEEPQAPAPESSNLSFEEDLAGWSRDVRTDTIEQTHNLYSCDIVTDRCSHGSKAIFGRAEVDRLQSPSGTGCTQFILWSDFMDLTKLESISLDMTDITSIRQHIGGGEIYFGWANEVQVLISDAWGNTAGCLIYDDDEASLKMYGAPRNRYRQSFDIGGRTWYRYTVTKDDFTGEQRAKYGESIVTGDVSAVDLSRARIGVQWFSLFWDSMSEGSISSVVDNLVITMDESGPAVIATDPPAGAEDVHRDAIISITFDEKVFQGPGFGGITLARDGGGTVDIVLTLDGSTLLAEPMTGLEHGAAYVLTVPAGALLDDAGNATESDYLLRFTVAPPDTQPPSPPGGVSAVCHGARWVNLSWEPATDDRGVAGYVVMRGDGPEGPFEELAWVEAEVCSWRDTGIAAGSAYYYQILAEDEEGNLSAPSSTVGVTTGADNPLIRVSVASDGTEGDSDSWYPSISDDGRYVVFTSYASNLAGPDENWEYDIFLHDCETGVTERITNAYGGDADGWSGEARISGNGRYVVFTSDASNLVHGDSNNRSDVFLYDRESRTTVCISKAYDGGPANNDSGDPRISADGSRILFYSHATNLTPEGKTGVFLYDAGSGQITRLTDYTSDFALSGDGRYAACEGTGQVGGITRLGTIIFDLAAPGAPVMAGFVPDAFEPALSYDGRYLAFRGLYNASIIPEDTNGKDDIFVRDLQTGATELASVASDGTQGNGYSYSPAAISADGRYVAFCSRASNLVPGDTNGDDDVFVRDRLAGQTVMVSVAAGSNVPGNGSSESPAISADGKYVAFQSWADNLVPHDTNYTLDVFRYSLSGIWEEGSALAVRRTDPVNGAAGVLVSKTIKITFNRPVQPGPDWEQIALKDGGGSDVPAARSIEGAELILDPEGLLAYGARYTVRLPARGVTDAEGNALAGDCVFVFDTGADAEPPGTPPGFWTSAEGAHTIRLTWAPATDDVGVVAYEIARSRSQGGPFEVICLAGAADTGYLDGGLEVNATYYYRIVALDAAGNRSGPAEAKAITLDVTPPAAPAGLAAVGLDLHRVSLSWQAALDDVGVASYLVYRALSFSGPFELITEVGGSTLTLQDTGLLAGTPYYYCVKARDAAGNESAPSAVAEARTAANQPPEITPDRSVWEIGGRQATLTGGVADPQGVAAVWVVSGGREWPAQLSGGRWSVQVEMAGYKGVFTIKARDSEGAEGSVAVTVRDCSVHISGFGFTDPIAYGSGSACTPFSRLQYQYTDYSGTGIEVQELAVEDRAGRGQAVVLGVSVEGGGSPGVPTVGKIEFIPQAPMPPGLYTLRARVVNRAGMAAPIEQDFTVYANPPTVEIYQPVAGAEVAFGTYFEGRVLDHSCQGLKSWQAALNGVPLGDLVLDEEGKFKTALELAPGDYVLSLSAADRYGWMREGDRDASTVQVRFKVSGQVTAVKSDCRSWNDGPWKWWFKLSEFDREFLKSRGDSIPLAVNPLVTNGLNGGRGFSTTAGLTVKNPETGEVYEKEIYLKNFAHQEDPAFSWGADYPTHSLTMVPASLLSAAGEMEVTLRQYPGRHVEAAKQHAFIGYPAPYIHAGRDNWSHRPAYLKPYYGETVEYSPVEILAYVTDDTGTGIARLILEVDGREVSFSRSEKTGDVEVACALDLSQGEHAAKLTAVNGMGLSTTAVTVFTVGSGSAVPWMEVQRSNDTYQVYLSFSRELNESEKEAIKGRYISPSSISSEIRGATLKQVSVRRIAGGQAELVTDPSLAREILLAAMRGAYYGEHPQGASLVDPDLVEWINDWKDNWGYGVLSTLCPDPPPKPSRENVQKALIVSALAGGDTPSLLSGEMSSALSTFSTAVGYVSKVKDVEKVQDALEKFSPRGARVAGLVVDALSLVDEGAQISKDMAEAVFRAYWQAAALADYRDSLNRIALLIEDRGLRSTVNSLANFSFEEACEVIKEQAAETIRKKTVEKMREAFEDAVKESFKATNPVVAAVLTGLDVGFFLASYTGWEQAYTANFQGSYEAAAEEGFNGPAAFLGQGCLLIGRGKTDFDQTTDAALATKLQAFAASRFYGTVAGMMSIFKNYPGLTDRVQYEAAYRQLSAQLGARSRAAVPGLASSSLDYFALSDKLAKYNASAASLVVQVFSPVTIVITDPLGRRVGCDQEGNILDEILGAFYSGPSAEPQEVKITGPLAGRYKVDAYSLLETGEEPYRITMATTGIDGSVIGEISVEGTAVPGSSQAVEWVADALGRLSQGEAEFSLSGLTVVPPQLTAGASGSTVPVDVRFSISRDALVRVEVKSDSGDSVATLVDGEPFASGEVSVYWDGTDDFGRPVYDGSYQVVARAEDLEGSALSASATVTVDLPLRISGSDPEDGAGGIAVNKSITIMFDGPVQPGAAYDGIALRDIHGNLLTVNKTLRDGTLTVVPEEGLRPGATYILTLPEMALWSPARGYNDRHLLSFSTRPAVGTGGSGGSGGGTKAIPSVCERRISLDEDTVLEVPGTLIIEVPAGAVKERGAVIKAAVRGGESRVEAGMTLLSPVVETDLINGNLQGRATIAIYHDRSKLTGSAQPAPFRYDPAVGRWVRLDGMLDSAEGDKVIFSTDCLGAFAVFAVIPGEATPSGPFRDLNGHWAKNAILKMVDRGIVLGYPDGTFRPENPITRAEAVTLVARCLNLGPVTRTDIRNLSESMADAGQIPVWALEAAAAAVREGIVKGDLKDGLRFFDSGRPITRAEFVVVLARAFRTPSSVPPPVEMKFVDYDRVPAWAKEGMDWAAVNGIIVGYSDGTLRPGEPITRAEAAVMLGRILDKHENYR